MAPRPTLANDIPPATLGYRLCFIQKLILIDNDTFDPLNVDPCMFYSSKVCENRSGQTSERGGKMNTTWIRLGISGLLIFCQPSLAAIDPDLVGVWRSNDSLKLRIEFKSDSTMTNWFEKKKGGVGPLSSILEMKDRNKRITMLNQQHFRIGKGEKAGYFHYQITVRNPEAPPEQQSHRLEFYQVNTDLVKPDLNKQHNNQNSSLDLNAMKFVFNKMNFKDPAKTSLTGDYQTHKNMAFESLMFAAIKAKNIEAINRFLSSSDAKFLTATETKKGIVQGRNMIRRRLWDAAADTSNAEIISAFYQHIPDGYNSGYLQRAMKDKNEPIVALYKRLRGVKDSDLPDPEKYQLQFVLYAHAKLLDYALSFDHLIGDTYGCRKATIDPEAVNRMKLGEIKPDLETQARLDWGQTQLKNMQKDWATYVSLVEDEFRFCLQQGYGAGPISRKAISAVTTPGEWISYRITPLYHYAQLRQQGSSGNSLSESTVRYAAMNVLLEMGADPKIKPASDSMSLADHMFVRADHKAFHQALKSSNPDKHPMMVNIRKYNEIMKKIGGPEYDMSISARDVYDKHKAFVASGGASTSTQQASDAVVEKVIIKGPETQTKPVIGAIAKLKSAANKPVQNQPAQPQAKKSVSIPVSYKMPDYWHMQVVTVNPEMPLDPSVRAMWKKGMYLHFRKDGVIGFNTDSPGPYLYAPVNQWRNSSGVLTLTLTDISYIFTLPKAASEKSLTTLDNKDKQFKMTLLGKEKGKI